MTSHSFSCSPPSCSSRALTDWHWHIEWINLLINIFLCQWIRERTCPQTRSSNREVVLKLVGVTSYPLGWLLLKKEKKSMEKMKKLEPLHRNKFGWCRFYLIKQKLPYKIWGLFCSSMPSPALNNYTALDVRFHTVAVRHVLATVPGRSSCHYHFSIFRPFLQFLYLVIQPTSVFKPSLKAWPTLRLFFVTD